MGPVVYPLDLRASGLARTLYTLKFQLSAQSKKIVECPPVAGNRR